MSTPIVGVDIGGTFTDFVYVENGTWRIYKRLTTRPDPSQGLLAGLDAMGASPQSVVAHGTTVATNAVLEHKGARTGLITTQGFRDVLVIGRQARPHIYRLWFPPRWVPVPEAWRMEVRERVAPDGRVLIPLDKAQVEAVLDALVEQGVESVAVSLLFSFANPEHERYIGEQARQRGLFVSLSSEILPEFREFERTSTTVLNAYVSPIMARYLRALEERLRERGHPALWIMQSSGGILDADRAGREAVRTLLSGPAAGVIGAFAVAQQAGFSHIITLDMGGTSTDVSLADGRIRRTTEGRIESWPVQVPMMDIHTVGAGGGSLAWIDPGGALRVGPESAGSRPGPACYGLGGQGFTVTDANLLLGRLSARHFLGGRMRLYPEKALDAAHPLAERLGISPIEVAEGVIAIANARMSQAIRVISIERGFDPREFTLVAFGGAGPMHALELARELLIPRVLIPRYPGVLSALGLTLADFVRDFSRTLMRPAEDLTKEDLQQAFGPLLAQAEAELQEQGFGPEDRDVETALDMRYRGQSYELTVPIQGFDLQAAVQAFHQAHKQRYGYARPEAPVEVVNVRVIARGRRPKPRFSTYPEAPSPDPEAARLGTIELRFAGKVHSAPIYDRAALQPGHRLQGPALVVQEDATTVVPPGWRGYVDAYLNLIFEAKG